MFDLGVVVECFVCMVVVFGGFVDLFDVFVWYLVCVVVIVLVLVFVSGVV